MTWVRCWDRTRQGVIITLFELKLFNTPIMSFLKIVGLALLLAASASASPRASPPSFLRFTKPRVKQGDLKIIIDTNQTLVPSLQGPFADPGIIRADDGKWYAFSTQGPTGNVPVAVADQPLGNWTKLDQDAMPDDGWTSGKDFWAPDVRKLNDGTYVMYFSGRFPGSSHCIGVSRSDNVTGPYEPDPEPFACPLEDGGAIDPAGFYDEATGRRYVMYKVDGELRLLYDASPLSYELTRGKAMLLAMEAHAVTP